MTTSSDKSKSDSKSDEKSLGSLFFGLFFQGGMPTILLPVGLFGSFVGLLIFSAILGTILSPLNQHIAMRSGRNWANSINAASSTQYTPVIAKRADSDGDGARSVTFVVKGKDGSESEKVMACESRIPDYFGGSCSEIFRLNNPNSVQNNSN